MATAMAGEITSTSCIALYNLPEILAEDEMTDVTVEVNSRQFKLHRVILASCSDFFRALFRGEMRESTGDVIPLSYDSLTTEAFEILVEFAYKSKLKLTNDNVFEVFMAADHLQMLGAMKECGEYIVGLVESKTIPASHLLTIADFVSKYNLPNVLETVTKSMAEEFTNLSETKEFREEVTFEKLAELLERNDLVARSEADVFRIVLRWVDTDEENRIGHLENLLRRVRLLLIDPTELTDLMDNDRFRKLPCYRLYIEAVKYHARCRVNDDLNHFPRYSTKVFVKVNFNKYTYILCYHQDDKWKEINFRGFKHHAYEKSESEYVQTVVVGNTLYVVHGGGATHKYTPETQEWTALDLMKEWREKFLLVHDGREYLYALGGELDGRLMRAAERYHIPSGKWRRIASLPESGGKHAAATVHEGKIVYFWNQTGYWFDADRNRWEEMVTYESDYHSPVFATVIDGQLHLYNIWNGTVHIYRGGDDAPWDDVDQGGVPEMWKARAFRGIDDQVYIIGGIKCYPTNVFIDNNDPYDADVDDWKWMMRWAEKFNIVEIAMSI